MLFAVKNLAHAWRRTLRRYVRRGNRRNRRGAALVELAVVLSLLLLAMMGVGEFGLMFRDWLTLHQAAREGVRVASIGATDEAIATRVSSFAPSLDTSRIALQTRYSTDDGATFAGVPGVSEGINDIPAGALIRVHAEYPHRLAFRLVLPQWTEVTLRCNMVMQRQ